MPRRTDSLGFGATLPATVGRVVEASAEIRERAPERLGFQHAVLCQVGLPRRHHDGRTFERTSGTASLLVEAGRLWDGRAWREQPLPYGPRPRLALIHVITEAVRTRSPVVEVGNSVREFLTKLGSHTSGRDYAAFRRQMMALAACRMTLGMAAGGAAVTVDAKPFKRFEAWLHPTGDQHTLWPGELELTGEFYDTLREHAVPLDHRALAALAHSALAIDIYTWLAHRLHRVRKAEGVMLSWGNLREQFGTEYRDGRDFKRAFRLALRQSLAVYPEAKVEDVIGGVRLRASLPPVRQTRTLVRR